MKLELVPLNIPKDWTVVWNKFTQSEPENFLDEDYINIWEFPEDIFYFRNESKRRILDLGCIEHNPNGCYRLVLIEINENGESAEDWDNPLFTYKTKNIFELQKKINWILNEVSLGKI